eukprot:g9818.t1
MPTLKRYVEGNQWTGTRCECLQKDADVQCEACASGYFGPRCLACPGGGLLDACNGHGSCNDGVTGDGSCNCHWDIFKGGFTIDNQGSCTECAPNFGVRRDNYALNYSRSSNTY